MKPFHNADYAAIECRVINWLAGQEDALERFRAYDAAGTEEDKHQLDPYRFQASRIFEVPVSEINKFPQRFVGKSAELGCGFGMGPPKFRTSCKKTGKYDLPTGLEFTAVKIWRATHKKVVKYWYDVENAAKEAIWTGKIVTVRNVSFAVKDLEGTRFLLIKLPSGRKLAYPRPRVIDGRITFFGHIIGTQWGDVETYGGKLAENITQAVAADIMCIGASNVEAEGYEIAALVHDEALGYSEPWQTIEEFVRLLTVLPSWADGLPIEAKGALVPFYKKD